jgi:hypothetical protein
VVARALPSYQAYQVLHWAFVIVPVIAGLDKFTDFLCVWDRYLAPEIATNSPVAPHQVMLAAGVVEVFAGLIVAIKPKVGAWLVAAWLVGILVNLVVLGRYLDVALRDIGLLAGALALARLAATYDTNTVIEEAPPLD